MPAVTLTKIVKEPGGKVRVRFGKTEYEYADIATMRATIRASLNAEDLHMLTLALALTRQPNLGSPAALEGRTLTLDFNSNNVAVLT